MAKDDILNAEQINSLAYSFQKSRVLLTAIELDIFSVLGSHLMSAEDVAKQINVDAKAVERLMNALVAIGFLRKVHGKFYNTEAASKYLIKGKPDFIAGLFHTNNLWKSWSTLTNAVIEGKSVYEREEENRKDRLDSFIAAMNYRALQQAKIIGLMLELSNVNKMLDVGGGSGAFTYEFMKLYPKINGVIFDLPDVITLTKKYAEEQNFNKQITFIEGDYLVDDFGSGYDLILLSAIVHINSFEQNKQLIKKCADALNNNGQIVIRDFIMDEDRTNPIQGTLFSLNMLVATENGNTYTENEMKEWLTSAGIKKIERKKTSFGSDLIIGKK